MQGQMSIANSPGMIVLRITVTPHEIRASITRLRETFGSLELDALTNEKYAWDAMETCLREQLQAFEDMAQSL